MGEKMFIYPNEYFSKIEDINIEFLQKNKIKALILDMDNTLINYKKEMPKPIEEWAKNMPAAHCFSKEAEVNVPKSVPKSAPEHKWLEKKDGSQAEN